MKRYLAFALVLALALTGAALAAESVVGELEGFPWTLELRAAAAKDGLHTAAGMQQYDGSVLDVAYDDDPAKGNVFLILTFTITKTQVGGGPFDWANLSVRDADGNAYARMENDAFLQNHTYNRIQGTPLQIGENKGSACFEIPTDAAKGNLTLVYDAGEFGTIEIPVKPE